MFKKIWNRLVKIFYKESLTNGLEDIDIKIGMSTIYKNLKVINRKKSHDNRPKLLIGDHCIISNQLVFESGKGSVKIGDRTFIGGGQLICVDQINVGNDVLISWGCTIMDNDAHSLVWEERKNDLLDWKKGLEEKKIGFYKDWSHVKGKPIVIKDKAWIGFNSIILKGVTIGEGAVVGAGSVVREDVPDYSLVIGNPAKVVKRLK